MYSPMGRIFLFLLVGTMAVVVDTYGVYVMGATYANMVFNVIVVFICKEYCLKMRLKHSKRECTYIYFHFYFLISSIINFLIMIFYTCLLLYFLLHFFYSF